MDVEKAREIIDSAKTADQMFNSMKLYPTLCSIDYNSSVFLELDSTRQISYFMLMGKLCMLREEYKKADSMLKKAGFYAKRSEQSLEKYYWAEIQRGRLFDQKGTVGDRTHAQNIFNKILNDPETIRMDEIRACADFYYTLTQRLYGHRTFNIALNSSFKKLKAVQTKHGVSTSKLVLSSISSCEIWNAIQFFRAEDSLAALKSLRRFTERNNNALPIYIHANIESAFIIVFGLKEYGYARILLDEVSNFYDNLDPILKIIFLLSNIEINKRFCQEAHNEIEMFNELWNKAGDLTRATFKKQYSVVFNGQN